jgi:hypothetical protein
MSLCIGRRCALFLFLFYASNKVFRRWYNTPPTKPPNKKIKIEAADADAEGEGDSKPLDFDTFVPSHDAALPAPAPSGAPEAAGYAAYGSAPPLPGVGVASQDEAFTRALEAMYWGGYWTAVYHVRAYFSCCFLLTD